MSATEAPDKPKNAGRRWTAEQDAWLLEAVQRLGIADCARELERTRGAVVARLCLRATARLAQDASLTPEAVAPAFGVTVAALKDFIAHEAKRAAALKEKQTAAAAAASAAGAASGSAGASGSGGAAAPAAAARRAPRTGGSGDASRFSGSARRPREAPADLNAEQREAVAAVRRGDSILLTGPAGTGKTHTVHAILADADHRGARFGLTATTGAAAVLIGGRTVHSFLGIGLARRSPMDLAVYTLNRLAPTAQRIRDLDVLLIDEISMMSDALFTTISKYLSLIRKDPAPFGGVQVVLVGDFAQLPPVEGDFAFKSPEWARLAPKVHELREIFRQAGDAAFQQLLHRARIGAITDDDLARLRAARDKTFPEGFVPTRLYARNAMVSARNEASYEKLKAENPSAEVVYHPKYSNARAREWGANTGYADPVALCPGAQVMITWNVAPAEGLINGTRGRVVALRPEGVALELLGGRQVAIAYQDVSTEDSAGPKLTMSFLPLKLAYAMSIHKSQGSTLDAAETDLGESIFEAAQAYVALSRVRDLDSIRITSVLKKSFRAHPDVIAFYRDAAAAPAAEPAADDSE